MSTSLIGLAALAALACLPFLLPAHTAPIPSFHAEWLAALLGLGAAVALLGARRLPLPGAALLALALAGIAAVQAAVGRAPVPQLTALFGLYLLWAALIACAARQLGETRGQERLARILAAAVLAGAALAATAALLQPWLQPLGWTGFPVRLGGPLGQLNHLVDYLWLGLASALYLRTIGTLRRTAFWLLAGLLTLAAVLAGQRSSFLYAAALVGVAYWQRRAWRDAPADGRRLALGIGLLFLVLQPLAALLPATDEGFAPPPAMRTVQQMQGTPIRLQLARLGAAGMLDAPLLGNGVGSYPGLALRYAESIAAANPGPAEHAHSLPIDLAAELGLPAALLALAAAAAWLRALPRRAPAPAAAWAASALAIVGLHSLMEYPLWHAYFLGLFAAVAGAFGGSRGVGGRGTASAVAIVLLAWGALALGGLKRDYANLETALALGGQRDRLSEATAALLRVPRQSLLVPWVNTAACVSLDPLRVPLADGEAVCRAAIAFAPGAETGVNLAVLMWRSGDAAGARRLIGTLRKTSRSDPPSVEARLQFLLAHDDRLSVLQRP